jgi:hypothetical protein
MPTPAASMFRLAAAIACSIAGAGVARAELIKVSPFQGPQNAGTQSANAALEYRGVAYVDGAMRYRVVSIIDPAHKMGKFLVKGERDASLDALVKQASEDNTSITVEHGGQTLTLPLRTAKVVSTGAPAAIMAPVGPAQSAPSVPNVSQSVIQTVVPNPTPADEQRRLEAVVAEVAKRRAAREQASQQQAQQQTGTVPTGVPQASRQTLQQQQQQQGGRMGP